MSKTEKIEKMKQQIRDTHAMKDGQAWGWEGCGVKGTDVCEICGLQHAWGRNGQNTGDFDEYYTADGEKLTLAQAAKTECE